MLKILYSIILVGFLHSVSFAQSFIVFSDPHLNIAKTTPMDLAPTGFQRANDLDATTFVNELKTVRQKIDSGEIEKPQFVLLLGDIVGHDREILDSVKRAESLIFSSFKKYFPETAVFSVPGNNDSFEVNYGPYTDASGRSPYRIAKTQGWKNGFLSTGQYCQSAATYPCLIEENPQVGHYVAELQPQLRLLAINSVLFSPRRTDSMIPLAQDELGWIKQQFTQAKANHESLLIAMHIPVGFNMYDHSIFWEAPESQAFIQLLQQYHSVIQGILVGHTHMDELKIIERPHMKLAEFFTPGLSTSHGNSPSFKVFSLTKHALSQSWFLSDTQTFRFFRNQKKLDIKPVYRFRTLYCAPSSRGGNILACLNGVTIDKVLKYITAGNENYSGDIHSTSDLVDRRLPCLW